MNAVIDIVLIAVFLITVIAGIKNGLVRSILGIVAVVFSLTVSTALSPHAADAVYENVAKIPIEHVIAQNMPEIESVRISQETVDEVLKSLPPEFISAAESFGVDVEEIAENAKGLKLSSENMPEALADRIIKPIALNVLQVISFTALFLIINVILQIIITIVTGLFKIPVIHQVDSVLGGLFGALKGLIVISFMALFLSALSAFFTGEPFALAVENSKIVEAIISTGVFARLALI